MKQIKRIISLPEPVDSSLTYLTRKYEIPREEVIRTLIEERYNDFKRGRIIEFIVK